LIAGVRENVVPGALGFAPITRATVKDRIVQAALKMVIEPIFEVQFREGSYGFRPGRGCKDALREVDRLLKEGYTHVVDADLKGYFDSIPHDRLMAQVEGSISDGRVLSLIESFLHQDIMTEAARWQPDAGTTPRLRRARLQGPCCLRCWRTSICIRSTC